MNKINMYWYKMENGQSNFGDEIGPFLVTSLSGKPVRYIPIVNSPVKILLHYFRGLAKGTNNLSQIKPVLNSFGKKNILISAGSIIGWFNNSNANVWGAGIMNRYDKINNANFYAVRGKYTQMRLKEHDYKVPEVVGDPAILLPLIVKPKTQKKYKLGIIPHYIHFEEVVNLFPSEDVLIINLLDSIDKVIEDITSCEMTISSSLHGIIVSHAYKIPCLWYKVAQQRLSGDNVKFKDYFSSVDIEEYEPFDLYSDGSLTPAELIIENINSNNAINKSNQELKDLQKGLLKVAPFDLKEEFVKLLNS